MKRLRRLLANPVFGGWLTGNLLGAALGATLNHAAPDMSTPLWELLALTNLVCAGFAALVFGVFRLQQMIAPEDEEKA